MEGKKLHTYTQKTRFDKWIEQSFCFSMSNCCVFNAPSIENKEGREKKSEANKKW